MVGRSLFEVRIEQTLEGLKSVVFLSTARKGSPDKEKFQTEFPVWDPTYCSWNLQEGALTEEQGGEAVGAPPHPGKLGSSRHITLLLEGV